VAKYSLGLFLLLLGPATSPAEDPIVSTSGRQMLHAFVADWRAANLP
jgi:hypothetical protein